METYADLLKREKEKVEKNMTNYDMDQLRREGKVPDLDRRADYDGALGQTDGCLLYTSPSPRDGLLSRMPSSA